MALQFSESTVARIEWVFLQLD